MKKGVLHPLWDGLKRIKKLLVAIIMFVLLVVHMGLFFILKDFSFGYRYYEFNEQVNNKVTVGYSKKEINMFSVMDEYLEQLEDNGYYIASYNINKKIYSVSTIIPKHKIDDEAVKKEFINSLDVSILCKKVTINEDVYYFKNDNDKDKFVNELNSIKKTEYSSEEVIEDKSVITEQNILDEKINKLKEEKRIEEEQEEKNKREVTSRGGYSRNTSYSGGAPMATYSYISSPYGMRRGKMHTGTDFAAPAGTPIYAWKSGVVTKASWGGSYGNFIIVKHNDGIVSRYAHCSRYACSVGQFVQKGQTIGYVGTTGNSTGNHLHFEIQINGRFVNPLNYI